MKRAVLVGAALLLLTVSVATAAPASSEQANGQQAQGLGLDVYTVPSRPSRPPMWLAGAT